MPSISTVMGFALAGASLAAAAPVVERSQYTPPAGWATGYLENYDTYHIRYLALDCADKHNTQFFDDCCHPLLATETLAANRKPYCTPSSAEEKSATAAAATETTTDTAEIAAATSTAPAEQLASPAPSSTTTSEAAQETQSSSSSSDAPSSGVNTGGFATFFYQGGNPGACGTVHDDSFPLVAIDGNGYWQNYGQESPLCGKSLTIKNTQNGKTVVATVQDVCPTCANDQSLDLSTGAFNQIADESQGEVPIEWWWN